MSGIITGGLGKNQRIILRGYGKIVQKIKEWLKEHIEDCITIYVYGDWSTGIENIYGT